MVSICQDMLNAGLAQIPPVWLDKEKTLEKIANFTASAGSEGCDLVVFGEALLPGYPFWLSLTHGSEFNSKMQKELHAHYARNAVCIEDGELDGIRKIAEESGLSVYPGIVERPGDRGGHSLYCSLVFIDREGEIRSAHRKLQPTYEERLTRSPGDGNGLKVHRIGRFTAGGLNCWENWMPLPRAALYGMGEDLHVAVWPGSVRNTEDITRFIAKEARSFVVSASGLMFPKDIPENTPYYEEIVARAPEILADGGFCIAGPGGDWIVKPEIGDEALYMAKIHFDRVLEERQNLDVSGHYARPDVTRMTVNSERQSVLENPNTNL